jgi:hypothetical protein
MKKTRKPKEYKSKEQQEIENVKSQIEEYRRGWIPQPTRSFNIGDNVEIGNLDNTVVLESIDGGKLIKVKFDRLKAEGSRDPSSYGHIGVWPWFDVFPYRTDLDNKSIGSFKNNDFDIHHKFSFQNRQISGLLLMHYRWGINFNPVYQRPLIWSMEDKCKLIESMFNNADIGKFALIKLPYQEGRNYGYDCLDGKQRLCTLMEFFEDRFTYEGYYFSEMSRGDKRHLDDYPILYAEASGLTRKEIYAYFLLLNVAGVPQSEEHLKLVKSLFDREK